MRFDEDRFSGNIESQRGMGGGGGMLLGLVASRFGIGGVVVLLIVMALFGGLGGIFSGGQQAVSPGGRSNTGQASSEVCRSVWLS